MLFKNKNAKKNCERDIKQCVIGNMLVFYIFITWFFREIGSQIQNPDYTYSYLHISFLPLKIINNIENI